MMITSPRLEHRSDSNRSAALPAGGSSLNSRSSAPTARVAARPGGRLLGSELAATIRERIESRLPGRIRKLVVQVSPNRVTLDGHCNTYYSKQLAQHAAMGVLEYQRLTNNIEVHLTK